MVKCMYSLCGNTLFRSCQSQKQLFFKPLPIGWVLLMDSKMLYTVFPEAAETVLSQIDTMKKAILARAFRGELGTNDKPLPIGWVLLMDSKMLYTVFPVFDVRILIF